MRLQRTYCYTKEGDLEIGDGIDLPYAEWHQLSLIWPEILFFFRFKIARTFTIIDDVQRSLIVFVKQEKTRGTNSRQSSTGAWIICVARHEFMSDGYMCEGEVSLGSFTIDKLSKYVNLFDMALKD